MSRRILDGRGASKRDKHLHLFEMRGALGNMEQGVERLKAFYMVFVLMSERWKKAPRKWTGFLYGKYPSGDLRRTMTIKDLLCPGWEVELNDIYLITVLALA